MKVRVDCSKNHSFTSLAFALFCCCCCGVFSSNYDGETKVERTQQPRTFSFGGKEVKVCEVTKQIGEIRFWRKRKKKSENGFRNPSSELCAVNASCSRTVSEKRRNEINVLRQLTFFKKKKKKVTFVLVAPFWGRQGRKT